MGSINSLCGILNLFRVNCWRKKVQCDRLINRKLSKQIKKYRKVYPHMIYTFLIINGKFIELTFRLKIRLKIFLRIQIYLLRQNSQNRIQTTSISISYFTIDNNSTSKINTVLGAIISPAPCSPYPNSDGINNLHLDPTGINCKASVQPWITWFTGKSAG